MAGNSNASILSATDLSVRYGVQTILDRATLAVNEGDRIGLVGRNGVGKSTFLRIAAGTAEPDSGQVVQRRELVVGYLPQDFQLDDAASVDANILAGAGATLALIEEYENLSADTARASELLDHINHLDGWNVEHRVKSLISHLDAPEGGRIVGTLSGGEKRRVALARALLSQPDLLILDEPTNHLDTESILWLEEFLAHSTSACLFVTHDRYFLDRVANRIVELAGGGFYSHPGNYTSFLEAKAARLATSESQEQRRQKFLKRELEWVRRGPRARTTKSRDRMDRYAATAAQDAPEEELDVELIIPPAPKLANRVIELRDAGFTLDDGRTLFDGLSLNLEAGQRMGIVGRNGLGKTTLLKVMLGDLLPTRGEAIMGSRTQVNYVDQARVQLDENKTVFEEVGGGDEWVRLGDESIGLRNYLGRFLFTGERINSKISLLSGGERSRVALAKILRRGGNVIVLDEPTNDLDLATLRVLEEALLGFGGTVIAVSHDRYFLNRVCTSILAFEGGGNLHFDVGNYDDYLAKRAARQKQEAAWAASRAAKPAAAPVPAAKVNVRKLTWKETRELENMEAQILAAEEEVARLEQLFAAPDFYQQHGERWQALEKELAAAKRKVPALYARWEELEGIRQAATATN
jgi:ATP-binding cassette subfamily F protein uup